MEVIGSDIHGQGALAALFRTLAMISGKNRGSPEQLLERPAGDACTGPDSALFRQQIRDAGLTAGEKPDAESGEDLLHPDENCCFFRRRWINQGQKRFPFGRKPLQPVLDFSVIIGKTGDAAANALSCGCPGDLGKIREIVARTFRGFIKADRIKPPGDGFRPEFPAEAPELFQAVLQWRNPGLQKG